MFNVDWFSNDGFFSPCFQCNLPSERPLTQRGGRAATERPLWSGTLRHLALALPLDDPVMHILALMPVFNEPVSQWDYEFSFPTFWLTKNVCAWVVHCKLTWNLSLCFSLKRRTRNWRRTRLNCKFQSNVNDTRKSSGYFVKADWCLQAHLPGAWCARLSSRVPRRYRPLSGRRPSCPAASTSRRRRRTWRRGRRPPPRAPPAPPRPSTRPSVTTETKPAPTTSPLSATTLTVLFSFAFSSPEPDFAGFNL